MCSRTTCESSRATGTTSSTGASRSEATSVGRLEVSRPPGISPGSFRLHSNRPQRTRGRCLQTDTQGNRSGVRALSDMDTDVLEYRLGLVERQIVDAERHVTLRRDNLVRLEADDLGASETANIARHRL